MTSSALSKLSLICSAGTSSAQETLVWKLCSMVNTEKLSALRNMLHSICVHLHKTCNLPTNIVHSLSQYIDTEHSKVCGLQSFS